MEQDDELNERDFPDREPDGQQRHQDHGNPVDKKQLPIAGGQPPRRLNAAAFV